MPLLLMLAAFVALIIGFPKVISLTRLPWKVWCLSIFLHGHFNFMILAHRNVFGCKLRILLSNIFAPANHSRTALVVLEVDMYMWELLV